ncbi:hypothetical protein, partial [Cohnella nanjingensis]|uniref:hypothetical protein n=1 Tax=Cohnella nanjingensis TaxID=1387779 RepID=UPI001C86C911
MASGANRETARLGVSLAAAVPATELEAAPPGASLEAPVARPTNRRDPGSRARPRGAASPAVPAQRPAAG